MKRYRESRKRTFKGVPGVIGVIKSGYSELVWVLFNRKDLPGDPKDHARTAMDLCPFYEAATPPRPGMPYEEAAFIKTSPGHVLITKVFGIDC